MRWLVVVVGLIAGCFAPDFPVGLPCGQSQTCPSQLECRDGRCERPGTTGVDAPAIADAVGDDGPDGSSASDCWAAWHAGPTFGTPRELVELSTTANESDPFLAHDNHTLYFTRGSPRDVFVAQRPDRASPFGAAVAMIALSSEFDEARVSLTRDGLVAALASDRPGNMDLFEATRSSPAVPFAAPAATAFAMINDAMSQHDPELSDDGLRIYFAPSVGTGQRLSIASRGSRSDPFGLATEVAPLVEPAVLADPTLSPDELVVVFAGTPEVPTTPVDLHVATRGSIVEMFTSAMPLASINTSVADADPSLSDDGCELVFSSSRNGGDRDLWIVDVNR